VKIFLLVDADNKYWRCNFFKRSNKWRIEWRWNTFAVR